MCPRPSAFVEFAAVAVLAAVLCACGEREPADQGADPGPPGRAAAVPVRDPPASETDAEAGAAQAAPDAYAPSAAEIDRLRRDVARDLDRQKATFEALIASLEDQIAMTSPSLQDSAVEQLGQLKAWRSELDRMSQGLQSAGADEIDETAHRLAKIESAFMAKYEHLSVAIANDKAESSLR